MHPAALPTPQAALCDADLVEQARPGYGIPSQDPDPAAQFPLNPEEAQREARSALAGGTVVGGAAVGATIGAMLGGPVGVVVGGTLGAVAGALGGTATTLPAQEEDRRARSATADEAVHP